MFCTYCGAKNNENSKFCIECGKALVVKPKGGTAEGDSATLSPKTTTSSSGSAQSKPPVSKSTFRSSASRAPAQTFSGATPRERMKNLATAGGVLVIICFFLPWMMVSCSFDTSAGIEVSGYDLSQGAKDLSEMASYASFFYYEASGYESMFSLFQFAILAIPICVVVGLILLFKPSRGGALFFGVVALIILLAFSVWLSNAKSELMMDGIVVNYRIGYWGTWLGLILLIYGSLQLPSTPRQYGSVSRY